MKSPFDNTPDNADQASGSLEELAVSLSDLAKNSKQARVEVNLSTRDLELMRKDLQSLSRQMDRQASAYWKNPQTHPAFAPGAGSQQSRPVPAQVQAQADQRRLTDAINHLSRLIESRGTGTSSTAQTAVTALGLAQVQQALSGQTTVLQGLGQAKPAQQQPPAPTQQPALPTGAVSQTLTPYLRQLDMARAGQMDREDLRGSLEELPGYRLKELRDLTGAEPGGRSNADLIERILGTVPAYQREEPTQAQQPTASPAQQPDQTQSAPPATVQAPQQPEQPAPAPTQPTAPSSVHAPFSLAAMQSQWQGNPPPTEEEIEKRMESMGINELRALRDEMKGEPKGRSKEDLRERIRAAHKRQQQEYQAFLASQASVPPATTATAEPPPTTATPTTGTPGTSAPTTGTPAATGAPAAAAPPASPPGIPPGAPPGAPEPSDEGEGDPQKNRPTRRQRPQTPAAPDMGELERRLPGMSGDQLRSLRDDLGGKGGRSNEELRAKIYSYGDMLHRQEYRAKQNTEYERAYSSALHQQIYASETGSEAHRRVAEMQAKEYGVSSLYQARMFRESEQAKTRYFDTPQGYDQMHQAAGAQVQGNQAASVNNLKQQVALEREKLKYMRSPDGQQSLKEEARLRRQLSRIQEESPWAKMVAEQGKFGAGISVAMQKVNEFRGKMLGMGSTFSSIWQMGTVGIAGLVAAADPFSTFPTLQESAKGLAIELGQGFLPVADEVSSTLQWLTKSVAGMDSATKASVARWVAYGVGISGVTAAAIRLGSALYPVGSALLWVGRAAAANPYVALAAVLGTVAANYLLVGRNAQSASAGMRDAADAARSPHEMVAKKRQEEERRSVYEALPAEFKKKYREAKDEEGRKEVLREHQAKAKEDLEKAKAAQLADKPANEKDALLREIDREVSKKDLKFDDKSVLWWDWMGTGPKMGDTIQGKKDRANRLQSAEDEIMKDLESRKMIKPGAADSVRETVRKKLAISAEGKEYRSIGSIQSDNTTQQRRDKIAELEAQYHSAIRLMERTGTQDGLTRAYRNMPAPQITDPMSYADRIQIQALKGDDLTAKNMARQLEALDKNTGLLKDVKDELRILNTEVRRNYRGH